MARKVSHKPVRARASEIVYLAGTFTTNNTSDPTVVTGDIESVSYDDVGDFTVTLKGSYPQLDFADACIFGNEAELQAKVSAHDIDAVGGGTLTVHTYDEDDTSGIAASADSTGKVVRVVAFARNTSLTSR